MTATWIGQYECSNLCVTRTKPCWCGRWSTCSLGPLKSRTGPTLTDGLLRAFFFGKMRLGDKKGIGLPRLLRRRCWYSWVRVFFFVRALSTWFELWYWGLFITRLPQSFWGLSDLTSNTKTSWFAIKSCLASPNKSQVTVYCLDLAISAPKYRRSDLSLCFLSCFFWNLFLWGCEIKYSLYNVAVRDNHLPLNINHD